MTIDEAVSTLRIDLPEFTITGGEEAEGFWIRAEKVGLDWTWERRRMHSAFAAYQLTVKALRG
jgi:hypothetical protein